MSDVLEAAPVDDDQESPELAEVRQDASEAEPTPAQLDALQALGDELQSMFGEFENDRLPIEQRWIEDTRQFNGQYDPDVLLAIREAEGSELFVNITRPKTNTFAARLGDMLLPTSERNFGVEHTPVPQLNEALDDHQQALDPATKKPMTTKVKGPDGAEQEVPVSNAQMARAIIETAKKAAEAMEDEIADQLLECGYNAIARQAIDELAQLGTGVCKGPIVTDKRIKTWKVKQVEGVTVYYAEDLPDPRPAVKFVSVWNLYPDMSASSPAGWRGVFEQFLCNKREFGQLAAEMGFYKEAVARVLEGDAPEDTSKIWWINVLRGMNTALNFVDERFRVLQYHGEIKPEVLTAIGLDPDELGLPKGQGAHGVVWFCRNVVLKVSLSPLDSGKHPYSVAYLERDPSSPFGLGVPRLMREEQKAANAAYRMIYDNAGLSVGPQVFIKAKKVHPVDGSLRPKPRKMWTVDEDVTKVEDAFGFIEFPNHQDQLAALFEMARRLADDTTSTPLITQGDQAPHVTKTAKGMSMLFNAANVVLRRCVKLFDDFFTVPMIERFYEWNMQFNDRKDIKGDFRCIGRGSSVLLEKEQMNETYQQVIQLALQYPDLKARTNVGALWEQALKNMRIEDAVLSEEEAEANRKKEIELNQSREKAAWAEDQAAKNPLLARKIALEERKHADNTAATLAKIRAELENANLGADARLAVQKIIEDATNQRLAVEAQLRRTTGEGV